MKDTTNQQASRAADEKILEREFAEIAPCLDRGFSHATPSQAVLDQIHQEAVRQTFRKRVWARRIKILSAAASLAILAGGTFHLLHDSSPTETEGAFFIGTAEDFLDLQSLNEETYFNEEANLWE